MSFAKQNPKIPEGINTSAEHPLKEFFLLVLGLTLGAVILVVLLSYALQWLTPYVPFHYEQKLSGIYEKVVEEVREKESPVASDTHEQAELALQELGLALSRHAGLPDDMALQFHLLSDVDTPNAFATLGGHIFVTGGLIEQVSSENALAMVLAHEIAHIKYRHPIQALGSGIILQLVFAGLLGGQDSTAINGLLGSTSMMTKLGFSRGMEHEADAAAHRILLKRYGHLDQADEFFVKMAALGGRLAWQEVFQTHPDIEKRIERLKAIQAHSSSDKKMIVPLDSRMRSNATE